MKLNFLMVFYLLKMNGNLHFLKRAIEHKITGTFAVIKKQFSIFTFQLRSQKNENTIARLR